MLLTTQETKKILEKKLENSGTVCDFYCQNTGETFTLTQDTIDSIGDDDVCQSMETDYGQGKFNDLQVTNSDGDVYIFGQI